MPLISVILPCYNAEAYIGDAIASLLAQEHRSLEIIVLNDGSTDHSSEVIQAFAERDGRIRSEGFSTNRGLIATLNFGLQVVNGEFIARMDADDLADPHRLSKQLEFFAAHPDVSVLGTATHRIRANDGRPLRPSPLRCLSPAGARFMSLFGTPVAHPTVLARSDVMRAYRYGIGESSLHTEDYELFARMTSDGLQFANLRDALVTRRATPSGVSMSQESTQISNFVSCAKTHLARETGFLPESAVHRVLVNRIDDSLTQRDLVGGLDLLRELEAWAIERMPEAEAEIRGIADTQRADILLQATRRGRTTMKLAALHQVCRRPVFWRSTATRQYLRHKVVPPPAR